MFCTCEVLHVTATAELRTCKNLRTALGQTAPMRNIHTTLKGVPSLSSVGTRESNITY